MNSGCSSIWTAYPELIRYLVLEHVWSVNEPRWIHKPVLNDCCHWRLQSPLCLPSQALQVPCKCTHRVILTHTTHTHTHIDRHAHKHTHRDLSTDIQKCNLATIEFDAPFPLNNSVCTGRQFFLSSWCDVICKEAAHKPTNTWSLSVLYCSCYGWILRPVPILLLQVCVSPGDRKSVV